ncbi:DUF3239 domain-containing protein [Achromobacter seleniivolatilans]|uniref:DUF3239 domain-containing protein n=1 Tax=Achromobacter seleniivolatilans TaxID=3047478 RepID=A0ABY9M3V3_9BURK|nr:DUF3239 domain-containing protein [Achromobacter sp. R39]WMD21372.1 DUF3239 domain-containing protein [Achromobacter sp. R39]
MEQHSLETVGPDVFRVGSGPIRNGSAAERHLEFKIDIAHARRYNQSRKEARKTISAMIVMALGLIAAASYLLSSSSAGAMVFGALTACLGLTILVIAGYVATQNRPQGYLDRGVLNPAIVCAAEKGQIFLLTLGGIGLYDKVWAVFITRVKDLPGHRNAVGERIPVTCVFTGTDGARYQGVGVSPIAWGTSSAKVLQGAVQGIDESEWQALDRLRYQVVLDTDYAAMGAKGIQVLNQAQVERLGLK